jgi:hypothetical protein
MHQPACVTLARAHSEPYKLEAQQRAVVLSMLAQALHRKLLQHASLLSKVIDAHFETVSVGIELIVQH